MLYRAKVARVVNANMIEAEIYLGFNLVHRSIVWLSGVEVADEALKAKAIHCLVVLIGGKKVFLEIEDPDSRKAVARVFRGIDEKMCEAFDGFVQDTKGLPGGTYPAKTIDVNEFMRFLSKDGFDVQEVKNRVIGKQSVRKGA